MLATGWYPLLDMLIGIGYGAAVILALFATGGLVWRLCKETWWQRKKKNSNQKL